MRELKDLGKIRTVHISGHYNKADLLTKCLPNYVYQKKLKQLAGDQFSQTMAKFVKCHIYN